MFGPFPGGSCAVQFSQATTELSQFGGHLRKVWLYDGRFDVIKYSPRVKTILSETRWRWLWGEGGHWLKIISQKIKQKRNSRCQVEQKVSNNANERKRGLKLNSWAWSSFTCILNTVYSVSCVVGAWKVEGTRKNGCVSPSCESVLSCAHYFPAHATQAIYSVTQAYRRQESDTWSQSKSGAWYTLLDWSRIFTSCFGRALVPPTKSWKHPTFFHSFISSHLMKSLAKSNEKRNCFLYQHCIKSQLRVHHSSLRGSHYIRYAHAQKLRKRRSSVRVPHPEWIWQSLFQLARGPYLRNILQTTMLFSVKKQSL